MKELEQFEKDLKEWLNQREKEALAKRRNKGRKEKKEKKEA